LSYYLTSHRTISIILTVHFPQVQAWRRTTPQEQSGKARFDLFDVVSHYDEAAELVEDPEERLLIAQLNLKAAIKGKNSMGTRTSYAESPIAAQFERN
jgi:hypothetical protein